MPDSATSPDLRSAVLALVPRQPLAAALRRLADLAPTLPNADHHALRPSPPLPTTLPLAPPAPQAQSGVRGYAGGVRATVGRWVRHACAAFEECRMGGAQLSAAGLAVVRQMLAGATPDQKASGLGPREWRELMATLGRDP